jgi:hypothetical protein
MFLRSHALELVQPYWIILYAAPSPYTGEGVKPHIKPCDVTMLNLLPLSLSTFCTDPQWSCLDIVVLVLMQCTAKIIAASGIATFA